MVDNGTAIIIASLVPTFASLINSWWVKHSLAKEQKLVATDAAAANAKTDQKIDDVHKLVNSGLTALVAATERAATAEGIIKGTADEKARALTEKKE